MVYGGVCQIQDEAVTIECFRNNKKYADQYREFLHENLKSLGYDCSAKNQKIDDYYFPNPISFKELLENQELNFNLIAEYIKIGVQPTITLIDSVINKIKVD